ncbi:magnesium/cobalt transporter CorA [Fodinibius sediminis]|uniref:Magnesium transport protein CorA n=1 Tax=Fodinibius sediminis TaxID=1214077 RepID=A0A521B8I3_9BACT|nr:magnesium/cobalt transporter CorA [Fodinibius sediminis]SMO43377.1 magnesium transporter [Fodinibius sediminis]
MAKKRFSPLTRRKQLPSQKPGTAPGTVEYVGHQKVEEVIISLYDYDEDHIDQLSVTDIEECRPYLENPTKTWIHVKGLHDTEKLKSIWSFFDLHPLIQEDIVNTGQHPKMETYGNCIFFVLRMFTYSNEQKELHSEQISIVLGPNYVLSFQETDLDHFRPILNRLSVQGGRLRIHPVDYLAYALLDTVVDHYFSALDNIGDTIIQIEDGLFEDGNKDLLHRIHRVRRETALFRKSIRPLREAINAAIRDPSDLISDNTRLYLRDVYDHIIQVIDTMESYRDMVLSLHDLYMSNLSNKMNEVMKVLTIIATIFIPLTFIAGIYGMNFNPEASPYNMPELNTYWGYPASLILMALIAVAMIFYFKEKEWL